jgi:hypothetical protein
VTSIVKDFIIQVGMLAADYYIIVVLAVAIK